MKKNINCSFNIEDYASDYGVSITTAKLDLSTGRFSNVEITSKSREEDDSQEYPEQVSFVFDGKKHIMEATYDFDQKVGVVKDSFKLVSMVKAVILEKKLQKSLNVKTQSVNKIKI